MLGDDATTRVAVLGLYRSGSTAVAGVLHRLGVNIGGRFFADYYEPQWLSEQLRAWWNEPQLIEQVGKRQRVRVLRQWVLDREKSGSRWVGAKHPLLCLCGEDLVEAWGEETKFIRTYRPIEQSIQSLVRLDWWPDAERVQQTLWDAVNALLGGEDESEPRRPHLRVDFAEMTGDPRRQIERIIEYLGLNPQDEQVEAAVDFIRPRDVQDKPAEARGDQAPVLVAGAGPIFDTGNSIGNVSPRTGHCSTPAADVNGKPDEVKIAATMLSGNSQEIVADAVKSVIDWVDWLLLIDTGITDDTAKIVEELAGEKFRCVPFQWCNDFALARNTSLEEAAALGATWALTVDTDERMLFPGFESLEQLRRYVAEHSKIISWLVSERGGNYAKERLIRVPTHLCWRGRTHEALVGAADRERSMLPGTYFYELSKSPEAYRKKLQRDLPILEEETRDQPDNPRWWYYLGQTLEGLERTREAAAAFRKRAELDGWLEEAAWACFKAASCHSQLNEFREAIELCAAGLAKQPGSPELAWLAGYCCHKLGENRDALYWSRMAIALGHVEGVGAGNERINFRHLPGWYEGPYDVMHWAYRQMGRESEARAAESQCDRARRKRLVDQAALAPPGARKVLFDLGAHHGVALRELKDHLSLDDTWEIHAFEPNPACRIKERLQEFDIPVQVHEAAVWIKDGAVKFRQQNHRVAQNRSPSDGRSDVDGWGSCLEDLDSAAPGLETAIEVECVDFAGILGAYSADDYIVVKMDLEGAEFALLRHLIEREMINRIKVLFIEWHARLLPDETVDTRRDLEQQLRDAGVETLAWK